MVFADVVQDMRSEDEEEEEIDNRNGKAKLANGHLENPADVKGVHETAEVKKKL